MNIILTHKKYYYIILFLFCSRENGITTIAGSKTGAGDPDYSPRGGWVWRVLRSSLPIQLCLVALLLAAWLVERPRCCDALNSLAQTLTPQLRYVRGPPPVWTWTEIMQNYGDIYFRTRLCVPFFNVNKYNVYSHDMKKLYLAMTI